MPDYLDVICKPLQHANGRVIYLRTKRGESHFPLEEAIEILVQMTTAIERAIDPEPLIRAPYVASAPLRPVSRPTPSPRLPVNLEDLS